MSLLSTQLRQNFHVVAKNSIFLQYMLVPLVLHVTTAIKTQAEAAVLVVNQTVS